MKPRRRHKQETELFTDSLNDILFILLMFFLITTTMANPNLVKVNNPKASKDTKAKQNIIVTIDKNHQFFLGTTNVPSIHIDSLLAAQITKLKATIDTPSVVVNADTIAYYGEVFRIMRIAKSNGARVSALVR
jgi:biopolymer transport protein ExbD